jgi:6-phosphogluconolactonase
MARWNLYVGTFTNDFLTEQKYVLARSNGRALAAAREAARHQDDSDQGATSRYSEGIEHVSFDDSDGVLHHVDTVRGLATPQSLELHPRLPVLYAAEWSRTGRVLAYSIASDGTLEQLSATPSLGKLSIGIAVHPTENIAYVVHWGDGTLTACALDARGAISEAAVIVPGTSSPAFERAHYHHVRVTPDASALVLTNVGDDALVAYELAPDGAMSAEPIARLAFPVNTKPRHLEFHPSGRFVYVVGEWDSKLHVIAAEGGIPTELVAGHSTMPPDYQGKNVRNAALCLHPDGRTLFVASRSSNTVTTFRVHESGDVELMGRESSLGRGPSAIKVDPTGRFLAVGNTFSGSVVLFGIRDDGGLEQLSPPVDVPAPRAFAFVPAPN